VRPPVIWVAAVGAAGVECVSSVVEGYVEGLCDGGSIWRYDGWAMMCFSLVACADGYLYDVCEGGDRIVVGV
jgi:hypothetical protein